MPPASGSSTTPPGDATASLEERPPRAARRRRTTEPLTLALDERDGDRARAVARALASEPRWRLLRALGEQLHNVGELAEALAMPPSTVTMHLAVLEEAGLVRSEFVPGQRGRQRVCQRVFDQVRVELPRGEALHERDIVETSLPVGAYADAEVAPTCGLAGPDAIIGMLDDPTAFYEPDHLGAQLVWFRHGRLAYRFPNRLPPRGQADTLWFSAELCSEAPMHHHDWPSDVSVWVNGVRLGHWTSPADFGGQRGLLTPAWWDARLRGGGDRGRSGRAPRGRAQPLRPRLRQLPAGPRAADAVSGGGGVRGRLGHIAVGAPRRRLGTRDRIG